MLPQTKYDLIIKKTTHYIYKIINPFELKQNKNVHIHSL